MTDPMERQIGGDHYQNYVIQPIEFFMANNVPFVEASVIKYVLRHKTKGGKIDLLKAKHCIDFLIDRYYTESKIKV